MREVGIRLTADKGNVPDVVQETTAVVDKLTDALDSLGSHGQAAARKLNESFEETSRDAQRLLDKYDPLGGKLRQLTDDFKALQQAASAGNVGASDDGRYELAMRNLQAQARGVRDELNGIKPKAKEAMSEVAEGAEKSAFATAGARRELIVLGHEAMTGAFSKMPGSFAVLAERMGSTGEGLMGIGAGLAVAAAGAYVLWNAMHQGAEEAQQMNNALALTNNYAGQTRGSMRALAQEISASGEIGIGEAKRLVTELASSGRIGAQAFDLIAHSAADFARATGQDADKIGPILVKLFEDPAKGAEALNRQMHFLTVAELDYIAALEREGKVGEAQAVLAEKLKKHLAEQTEQLGTLERAWKTVGEKAGKAWDAMLGLGREKTLEEKLADVQAKLNARAGRGGVLVLKDEDVRTRSGTYNPRKAALEEEAKLLAQIAEQRKKADAQSKSAKENEAGQRVRDLLQQTRAAQREKLQAEIDLLKADTQNDPAKVKEALHDKQQQLDELRRGTKQDRTAADKAAEQKYRGDIATQEGLQKLEQERLKAHLANLDALRKQGLLSAREEIDKKEAMQRDALDTQIAIAQRELKLAGDKKNTADVAKYKAEIERLQAQRDALAPAAKDQRDVLAYQQTEALDKWTRSERQAIEQLGYEATLLGKSREELERLSFARKVDQALLSATTHPDGTPNRDVDVGAYTAAANKLKVDFAQAQADAKAQSDEYQSHWENGFKKSYADYVESATTAAQAGAQAFTASITLAGNALDGFVTTGKLDFRSLMTSAVKDIALIIERLAVMNAMKGASDYFGWGTKTSAPSSGVSSSLSTALAAQNSAANGAVYFSGALQAYSGGGVLDRPTWLGSSNGVRNLGGEAGEEGLFPLKRMRNGKLGVMAQGGGGMTVVQNFNNSFSGAGNQADAQAHAAAFNRMARDQARQAALEAIAEHKRNNGMLSS